MRFVSYFVVLFTLANLSTHASPLAVGTNTCLFLDDYFVAEQSGLKRTWHQGKPHPKAIVAETEPWEKWIILYGGCFYDPVGKVYRMYYQTTLYPSGVPGVSFRQDTCYAESKDAIHWTKPKLGVVDFKGSKDNNIMFYLAGPCNAFIDPKATDPNGRIKAHIYFLKNDPRYIPDNKHGMQVLESPDGRTWKYHDFMEGPPFANPAEQEFVDMIVVGWDAIKSRYVYNWRVFSQHKIAEKANGKRRAIGLTWSDQLTRKLEPAVRIISPDDADDRRVATTLSKDPEKPDWSELYTMPICTYGNHYLGFITPFDLVDGKDGNGGGGLEMAFSNDGRQWSRIGQGTNMIANSDDPELYPNFAQFNAPFDMGDETWIFYSENNGTHGTQPFEKSRGRIRAGVWRKDGFVSLDAAGSATLITKPLAHAGKELLVNFQTESGGSVRVGLLDEKGEPITQFNVVECKTLKGDATSQKVQWVGGSDFSKRIGNKPVRLMFELHKAKLWSFRFAP